MRRRQAKAFEHGKSLCPDQQAMLAPAIDHDPGKRRNQKSGHERCEADPTQCARAGDGVVGDAVDQPGGGHIGQPGADEADELAGEKESVVARTAKRRSMKASGWMPFERSRMEEGTGGDGRDGEDGGGSPAMRSFPGAGAKQAGHGSRDIIDGNQGERRCHGKPILNGRQVHDRVWRSVGRGEPEGPRR